MRVRCRYVTLSSFTWMTMLAMDLADRFAFRPLMLHGRGSTKKYAIYLLSGCGIPCIVLLPCLVLHFCKCTTFSYGGPGCWSADPMSNIVAFGVPVAISLWLNIVLFAITIAAILQLQVQTQVIGTWNKMSFYHNDKFAS